MSIRLNEDQELVKLIREGLEKKGGYCPCRFERKEEYKCICEEFKVSIEVLKPESMRGITFEFENECSFAIKDEMKIPINKENVKGIYALSRIFSLDENGISTVGTNNVITFNCNDAIYTVTYGKNELPTHIEVSGETFEYSVDLKSIRLPLLGSNQIASDR